jgi:hypothetical protein
MVKSRLDGPPELTEIERTIAHGKLLLKALYADHPGQRLAARRPSRCCWHSGWRLRRCLAARGPPSCPKPGLRWVLDARHVGRITRRDDGLYQVRIDARPRTEQPPERPLERVSDFRLILVAGDGQGHDRRP